MLFANGESSDSPNSHTCLRSKWWPGLCNSVNHPGYSRTRLVKWFARQNCSPKAADAKPVVAVQLYSCPMATHSHKLVDSTGQLACSVPQSRGLMCSPSSCKASIWRDDVCTSQFLCSNSLVRRSLEQAVPGLTRPSMLRLMASSRTLLNLQSALA